MTPWSRRSQRGWGRRLLDEGPKALVLFCASLWIFDLFGISWSRPTVGLALLLWFLGSKLPSWIRPQSPVTAEPLSDEQIPSDLLLSRLEIVICLGLASIFAVATVLGWNVMSDYVFHWGLKAKHFALAGGLDVEFLAQPWNAHSHPDYPNLVPTLYASSYLLFGDDSWWTVAWLPVLSFALLLLACRELAGRVIPSGPERVLAVAVIGSACLSFAVGPMVAGGADLLIAFAVTAGVAGLTRTPGSGADRQVAWIAALAAASKIEGMVLAVALLILHIISSVVRSGVLGQGSQSGSGGLGRSLRKAFGVALRSSWPTAVVIAFWLGPVLQHGLFLESNTGGFDPTRFGAVITGLGAALLDPRWHGLPLILPVLPFLLLHPKLRLPTVLIVLQACFYLYAYLSGPVDTELWIQTSASRLFFHLLPAIGLLVVAAAVEFVAGND